MKRRLTRSRVAASPIDRAGPSGSPSPLPALEPGNSCGGSFAMGAVIRITRRPRGGGEGFGRGGTPAELRHANATCKRAATPRTRTLVCEHASDTRVGLGFYRREPGSEGLGAKFLRYSCLVGLSYGQGLFGSAQDVFSSGTVKILGHCSTCVTVVISV